jgi:hypothetical protein
VQLTSSFLGKSDAVELFNTGSKRPIYSCVLRGRNITAFAITLPAAVLIEKL